MHRDPSAASYAVSAVLAVVGIVGALIVAAAVVEAVDQLREFLHRGEL